MRDFVNYVFLTLVISVLTACYQTDSSLQGSSDKKPLDKVSLDGESSEDLWAKRAWIDKAARSLRYGEGISPAEDVDSLMSMPKDEIIEYLMKDLRFLDTILDFNLFFLGLKNDSLYRIERPAQNVESRNYDIMSLSPASLSSARAVWENGDYFKLFSFEHPFYNDELFYEVPTDRKSPGQSDRDYRLDNINLALDNYRQLLVLLDQRIEQGGGAKEFCEKFSEIHSSIENNLYKTEFPRQLINNFTGISTPDFDLQIACFFSDTLDFVKFKGVLARQMERVVKLVAIVDHPNVSTPQVVKSPLDILTFQNGDFGIESKPDIFSFQSWFKLPNSSTNFNRKRAAYVLKTYFCDDLTPINIALPSSHAGNKHADDPSCASCHYKMDPMAGFFRNRGIFGSNFENKNIMLFDDQALFQGEKYNSYMNTWKAPSELGREWNVGYIRSATDPKKNSYGDSIADLMKIIRTSNEVKQCLTKRMTEYFLGSDQVYDAGWVSSLAKNFEAADKSGDAGASSQAFKEVVKKLLLSNTFVKQDPEKNQCYDYAPGEEVSSLPCEVSFLINKNCVQCHSANGAAGGLDLSTWSKRGTGELNFSHIDRNGIQQTKSQTFEKLITSLSTNDKEKLMPLNKFMAPTERAQIYKWIERESSTAVVGGLK